jgi:PAS domain S-box-containing protein
MRLTAYKGNPMCKKKLFIICLFALILFSVTINGDYQYGDTIKQYSFNTKIERQESLEAQPPVTVLLAGLIVSEKILDLKFPPEYIMWNGLLIMLFFGVIIFQFTRSKWLYKKLHEANEKLTYDIAEKKHIQAAFHKTHSELEGRLHQQNKDLEKSEEKFRTLFENAPIGYYQASTEGRLLLCNSQLLIKFRTYSFEELTRFSFGKVESFIFAKQKVMKQLVQKDDNVTTFEVQIIDKNNKPLYLKENTVSVKDKDSGLAYYQGTIEDITPQKLAETYLEDYMARLEVLKVIYAGILEAKSVEEIADETLLRANKKLSFIFRSAVLLYNVVENKASLLSMWARNRKITKHVNERDFDYYSIIKKLSNNEYYIEKDIQSIENKTPSDIALLDEGIISYLVYPLKVGEELIGAFYFSQDKPFENMEKLLEIATEIAEPLAVAIRQARLSEENEIKTRDLESSLKEKEILLKEIHHRVKNNLQIIQSLLYLQSKNVRDQQALSLFKESQNRVKSMALIHENLYRSGDFANINFKDYIKSLAGHLLQTYQTGEPNIDIKLDISDVSFSIDQGIPCGLIVNELVSNSLKYAFPKGESGKIEISMFADFQHYDVTQQKYILNVKDNGIGLPENYDFFKSESLGIKLVHNLVSQLDGDIVFKNDIGTDVTVSFSC